MVSLTIGFLLAFAVTAGMTPWVRRWAVRHGVVDAPGGRRVHLRVTPRLGGIAIFIGFFTPLALILLARTEVAKLFSERDDRVWGLAIGSLVVLLVGAKDDWKGVGPWRKLLAQAVAASIAFALGYRIDGVTLPWIGDLYIGALAYPATVLWFLGITNAINLIDGLDGLAAGVALCACVSNLVISILHDAHGVTIMSACMAGALLGFLRHNFNPATVFMGDSGSMFVGFVLAATSLAGVSVKGSTALGILAPMVALGIPIFDTMLAVIRRAIRRQSIFVADRSHIHHRLLDMGLTHRRAVVVLYFGSIALSVAAIGIALGKDWQVGCALGMSFVTLVLMIKTTGMFVRRSGDDAVLGVRLDPPAAPELAGQRIATLDAAELNRQANSPVGL